MGVLRRIADAAREGLGKLESRKMVRIGGKPLSELTDRELEAELLRRRRLRAAGRAAANESEGRETSRAAAAVRRANVRQWYANLELPPGASADEVRAQYAALMARYDPEKHKGNPEKYRTALELQRGLTEAYHGLLEHLGEKS
ncbi:MAG TPA: hypothetical protein VIL20_06865 [Sandaracinaceae bacterium]